MKIVFSRNDLLDGDYVEPYCGGAGIGIELLQSEFAGRVYLNDVDPAIHAFWHSVLNQTEEFCRRIGTVKVSVANWRKQRAVIDNADDHDQFDLGFAAFFLNRVNRSGIISAGPIGGLAQTGEWGIDARFNRIGLIKSVEAIAKFKDRIFLHRLDAVAFLSKITPSLSKRSLIYLDPPYVVKGQRLYLNAYQEKDHATIAKFIQETRRIPWIASYDNVELIRQLYSKRRTMTYQIGYSANRRSLGSEIIIFSDNLAIPDVTSPLSINGTRLRRLLRAE